MENHLGYFSEEVDWGGMVNRPEDKSLLSQFNSKSSEDQFEKIGLLMSMRNVDTVSEAKIIPRQLSNLGQIKWLTMITEQVS